MIDLNNSDSFKHLDPKDVFGSTQKLYDQCSQVLQEVNDLNIEHIESIKNIVICGMGGSAYGGHVALSMFTDQFNVPVVINGNYNLPKYCNSETLVILTSYSGTTEETLSCANEAQKLGSKIFVLTSGGKLAQFAKENNLPSYVFNPIHNPSGQPRLGTGYIVFGTLLILNKLRLVNLSQDASKLAVENLKSNQVKIVSSAQKIAQNIFGKIPLLIVSEFLEGNAHIIRNQINETAKSFSSFAVVPELNHHLMEGLKNPQDNKLITLLINSSLYSEKNSKRMTLTKEVIEKNNIDTLEYLPNGESNIEQVLDVLSFGGYLAFYLAVLYGQDPSVIPWVDYFKEQLKK